jgi:magnesium chelatase accessory protein
MAAADLPSILAQAPQLHNPLTLVLGSEDAWIPEANVMAVIDRCFPDADVRRWDGGHLLPEEHPERATALIRELIRVS